MNQHNLVTDKMVKKGKESEMLRPSVDMKLALAILSPVSGPGNAKKMTVASVTLA